METNLMEIDLDAELVNYKGDNIQTSDSVKSPTHNMVLWEPCVEALLGQYQTENIDGEEKAQRYVLADRMYKHRTKTLTMSEYEVNLVKTLVAKMYGPIIVGPVYKIFEPEL